MAPLFMENFLEGDPAFTGAAGVGVTVSVVTALGGDCAMIQARSL
jgi:hypothetical protein